MDDENLCQVDDVILKQREYGPGERGGNWVEEGAAGSSVWWWAPMTYEFLNQLCKSISDKLFSLHEREESTDFSPSSVSRHSITASYMSSAARDEWWCQWESYKTKQWRHLVVCSSAEESESLSALVAAGNLAGWVWRVLSTVFFQLISFQCPNSLSVTQLSSWKFHVETLVSRQSNHREMNSNLRKSGEGAS